MSESPSLLVVAGETSGDHFASEAVRALRRRLPKVRLLGLGGQALTSLDDEMLCVPGAVERMGLGRPLARAIWTAKTQRQLLRMLATKSVNAVLLVGFSEFNALLLRRLSRETHVLWFAPPQVWAWRSSRARTIAQRCDQIAVTLPFESAIWHAAGARVEFVGHPSMTRPKAPRPDARARRLALLPGSRATEIERHIVPMLRAGSDLVSRGRLSSADLILSTHLQSGLRHHLQGLAEACGIHVRRWSTGILEGYDLAAVASGTATLDCMGAGIPVVLGYRTDCLTFNAARQLVDVPWIGLPNLVLRRAAFPELIQERFNAAGIAEHLASICDNYAFYARQVEAVQSRFLLESDGDPSTPAARVATLLAPWMTG